MTHNDFMKFKFQRPYIKFYWNADKSICLHTIYSCFCIATTGLNSCNRDHMSCKSLKYVLSGLLQKKLVDH